MSSVDLLHELPVNTTLRCIYTSLIYKAWQRAYSNYTVPRSLYHMLPETYFQK